jgi:hypothetical protein
MIMRASNRVQSVLLRRRFLAGLGALVASAGVLFGIAHADSAKFVLSVSPSSATVQPGSSERYTLSVTSEGGLAGTVNVGITSISPEVTNGPLFQLSRYDIWVSHSAPTGTARITATTSASTPAGTYTVTVTGKDITGGPDHGLTETTTFTLTVE